MFNATEAESMIDRRTNIIAIKEWGISPTTEQLLASRILIMNTAQYVSRWYLATIAQCR